MWRQKEKVAICKPRWEVSGETKQNDTLVLNFQSPEMWKMNFYCLGYPVCCVLLWQLWLPNNTPDNNTNENPILKSLKLGSQEPLMEFEMHSDTS